MEHQNDWKSAFDHNFVALIFVTGVLIFFTVCRCAKEDSPPVTGVERPPVPIPEPEKRLTATAQPLEQPNHYAVRLSWNVDAKGKPFTLYRRDKTGALKEIAKLDPKANHFDDESVTAGESYRYFLATGQDDAPAIQTSVVVAIPKDHVLAGESTPRELRGFNRLFITKGSVLRTLGQDLDIEANEIISDAGVISTFPQGARAPLGQNGRAGGYIRISAKRGLGQLFVQTQGESGGDGRDGENGFTGATGAPGQSGDWGMNPELYKILIPNFVDSFATSMRRYPRPPEDNEWKRSLGAHPFYICARPPTDGGAGGNGGPGKDGSSGGRAGDSAKVYVHLLEDSPLDVRVSGEEGSPGLGGRPGKGGPPGPGGSPGSRDQGLRCAPARQGPSGQAGIDGRQGIPGAVGVRQPICVKHRSRSFYDCDKFENKAGGEPHK